MWKLGVALAGAAATGVSGSASAPTAGVASGKLTPIPARPKRHKTKKQAHKSQASENTCQLEADVTMVYAAS